MAPATAVPQCALHPQGAPSVLSAHDVPRTRPLPLRTRVTQVTQAKESAFSSVRSNPAHLGGPSPEETFLPLLPLLQGQGFWFCFEFPRHFSVPLMFFFKGSSFLKDLLHQALAIYLVFLGSVSTYQKKTNKLCVLLILPN